MGAVVLEPPASQSVPHGLRASRPPRRLRRGALALWGAGLMSCGLVWGSGNEPPPAGSQPISLLTGPALRQALDQPLAATWENVDLRTIAGRISAARHVALVVDRRIDPSRARSFSADGELLGAFLERLAGESSAGTSVTGSVVYVGPAAAALKLRTLVALRQSELAEVAGKSGSARRRELTRATGFQWNDLDRPSDLVERLAQEHRLNLEGQEQIPHDLWGAATIPDASFVEALSLILIQWDLTFEWIDRAAGIRLVNVPERVVIEKRHRAPARELAELAIDRCRDQVPGLEMRSAGKGEIAAVGTIEQHEALERLLRPAAGPAKKAPTSTTFTLQFKNGRVKSLLEKLSGPADGQWRFEYDAAALRSAGIDLDQRISFEVNKAPIEELLKAALDPLGLAFSVEGKTIVLSPKR